MKKDEESEQEESPPFCIDEQPPIPSPSMLSRSTPVVHLVPSPANSPRTRPQEQQTPKKSSHLHIPECPQRTHLQTAPIPVPQQSEPHPFSSHHPLSHIHDFSL